MNSKVDGLRSFNKEKNIEYKVDNRAFSGLSQEDKDELLEYYKVTAEIRERVIRSLRTYH